MPDILKNLPAEIKKNKLKTGIFLGLSAYWGSNSGRHFNSIYLELIKSRHI